MERVSKIEDLPGIHGDFKGVIKRHYNERFPYRALADGEMTYLYTAPGEPDDQIPVTIRVRGVKVRRLRGSDVTDLRRYVRVTRQPKGQQEIKIIGLIDRK